MLTAFSVSGLPWGQWLRLHALNAGGMDLTPHWGTKTLYAEHSAKKKKKKKRKISEMEYVKEGTKGQKKKKKLSVSLFCLKEKIIKLEGN